MKHFLLILALTLSANAQAPIGKAAEPRDPVVASKVDSKLHADTIKLVEISGIRQRIQGNLKQMVADGKKQMMEKCQACSPEFADVWEKRMIERTNIQDYLDVFVSVYEKYFTDEEINELIDLQTKKNSSATASPSPSLKEKLSSIMPSVMGDSIGGCAKVGAKLGGEVGAEIEREHPEYVRSAAEPDKP
jgi:hypothetical protein